MRFLTLFSCLQPSGKIPLTAEEQDKRSETYFVDSQAEKIKSQKRADALARFQYLLGLTDLFRHFIDDKAQKDSDFAALIKEADEARLSSEANKNMQSASSSTTSLSKLKAQNTRKRKTEKEEDAELLQAEESFDNSDEFSTTVFTESPGYIHGTLREYQVQGLNWLVSLYENSISGILADEMGLGKTLQTISFLGYLRYLRGIVGPHIVIVPKSTLENWEREFSKWTPDVRTVVLQGDKESRPALIRDRIMTCDFDVVITSYEMVLREKAALRKIAWQYIVIDEAHRIKNENSSLSQIIRMFYSRNRLLITGTPLQNNLHELWALLNFILPDVFSDSEQFDQWFESNNSDQDVVVKQLHKVLQPFLLRRIKSDVEKSLLPKKEINLYIGMSDMQYKWYKNLLERNIDAVNGVGTGRGEKTRLLNIVMQLRKCCNHPYLFDGAEPGPPYTTDEHIIYNAGKMKILDKLLKRAKENGSRVLIFSQMSRMLDILEDYCLFRGYKYNRIDGNTSHPDRISAIDQYNRPGSEKFVFLLTTRAGGLGINLTTADTVVLYDSDWNPQADLQAMDRAHRIGQTKQVYVYRFVTENAIEEKVLDRAAQKLRLDQLVIQQGRAKPAGTQGPSKDALIDMIQYGAQDVLSHRSKESKAGTPSLASNEKNDNKEGKDSDDDDGFDDIEKILERGEQKTQQLNSRYEKLGLDDLQNFTNGGSAYEWNGQDFNKTNNGNGSNKNGGVQWIGLAKRERKENYSVDGYYKELINNNGSVKKPEERVPKPVIPKGPKQVTIQDFQFYPPKLQDIQDKELAYYRKLIGYKVPLPDAKPGKLETDEEREAEQQLLQSEINEAEPLTDAEVAEKEELSKQGFGDWNRRDFGQFINLSGKFGRNSIDQISEAFGSKTKEQIQQYAKAFWARYTEIEGYDKYINQIETMEEKVKRVLRHKEILLKKIESYNAPIQQLQIKTLPSGYGKKVFSEEEDRYLLVQMNRFGLDCENLFENIREAIHASPMFRFDWFFLSRTPTELSRRGHTLLTSVLKEAGANNDDVGSVGGTRQGTPVPNGNGKRKEAGSSNGKDSETPANKKKRPSSGLVQASVSEKK